MAHLDALHPRMRNHILDRRPQPRIRLEHLPQETPTRARVEVVDRRRARGHGGVGVRACGGVGGVEGVGPGLGGAPGELLEVQAVVDDAAGPDVDEARVVGWFF